MSWPQWMLDWAARSGTTLPERQPERSEPVRNMVQRWTSHGGNPTESRDYRDAAYVPTEAEPMERKR